MDMRIFPSLDAVNDSLFIGNIDAAEDLALLEKHGITHIVAAAARAKKCFPEHFKYFQI